MQQLKQQSRPTSTNMDKSPRLIVVWKRDTEKDTIIAVTHTVLYNTEPYKQK